MKEENIETHEFLPSGIWEGFYCYNNSPVQHKMSIRLKFIENKVSGNGVDDVAPFTWSGKYDLNNFKINKTKLYSTHQIEYYGDIDENGIWGIWKNVKDLSNLDPELVEIVLNSFQNEIKGGFHIWPKKRSNIAKEIEQSEEVESSKKLEEIYIEYFT
ncbi:hypothetical protein [Ochrovirga pacifica]|uniref:hypothetical protein n=1 Tax=Ochrovirga pacifica TaxID=1042376 RepID=UPI000255A24A|nr:hypothetical protein [Ochrovirga pacifica]